jgi:hypothetical protein
MPMGQQTYDRIMQTLMAEAQLRLADRQSVAGDS